ncbi:hypothetical protein IMZ68_01220 [Candidatus Bathyarchaeota archaeon]|nr:hypothetical protein [Candidatus Bathyarchaeota archaeon]
MYKRFIVFTLFVTAISCSCKIVQSQIILSDEISAQPTHNCNIGFIEVNVENIMGDSFFVAVNSFDQQITMDSIHKRVIEEWSKALQEAGLMLTEKQGGKLQMRLLFSPANAYSVWTVNYGNPKKISRHVFLVSTTKIDCPDSRNSLILKCEGVSTEPGTQWSVLQYTVRMHIGYVLSKFAENDVACARRILPILPDYLPINWGEAKFGDKLSLSQAWLRIARAHGIGIVIPLMHGVDPRRHKLAISVVSEIGGVDAMMPLIDVLMQSDDSGDVNDAAAALIKVGKPAVRPLIVVLGELESKSSENYRWVTIQKAAILRTLGTITGKDFGDNVQKWKEYAVEK